MTGDATFFWHDYETTGTDPRRDRPLQFAGVRTDADLEMIESPKVLYCQPPRDLLPAPGACAVTGIGPRRAEAEGLIEADFAAAVHAELARPGTCGVGYNSLRFDDEVTRHLLWRNFYDPYAREWAHGNSRWDVIDLFRAARALRPEGLEWPDHEPGVPSFRLEDLAAANGIAHDAHDALADVHATIELVRHLRRAQPRLYNYALAARDRRRSADLLALDATEPVLHVSGRYPARRGCIAPVAALARHPVDRSGVIVVDLAAEPDALIERDPEELAAALFTPAEERDDTQPVVPLRVVKTNRFPLLAPLSTLTPAAARRLELDPTKARERLARLRATPGLSARLERVFTPPERDEPDPDTALYAGLLDDRERERMAAVRQQPPDALATFDPGFADRRLAPLLWRYRARNWPETLGSEEQTVWRDLRWRRLCRGEAGSPRDRAAFRDELARLQAEQRLSAALAAELTEWEQNLFADLPPCGGGDAA